MAYSSLASTSSSSSLPSGFRLSSRAYKRQKVELLGRHRAPRSRSPSHCARNLSLLLGSSFNAVLVRIAPDAIHRLFVSNQFHGCRRLGFFDLRFWNRFRKLFPNPAFLDCVFPLKDSAPSHAPRLNGGFCLVVSCHLLPSSHRCCLLVC